MKEAALMPLLFRFHGFERLTMREEKEEEDRSCMSGFKQNLKRVWRKSLRWQQVEIKERYDQPTLN